MADLISPSGLLPDTIYTGYALDKFSWNYDSSVDDDVDVGQYYLAISEEQTPEDAPEWVWDRKMDLATFNTGFLVYCLSLISPFFNLETCCFGCFNSVITSLTAISTSSLTIFLIINFNLLDLFI